MPNYRAEHFPVALKFSSFRLLFEVSVQFEQRRIIRSFVMRSQQTMQDRKNAAFPVDQGSVAVKSENFEAGEVELDQST